MSRLFGSALVVLSVLALGPAASWAQNPHFAVCTATITNGTLIVAGQIAGLGNQMRPPTPLHLEATATAVCLDPTIDPPTLVGAAPVTDDITFPPKNGNRRYALVVDAPFVLPCDPPLEIVYVGIEVCDTTHDICCPSPPVPEPEPEPEPVPE